MKSLFGHLRIASGLALAVALALASLPLASHAAQFRAGGKMTIPAGDTLRDDLYLCGGEVSIDGVVAGDVLVLGGNIRVNGNVTGSLTSLGGSTSINGSVGRTLRSAGGEIRIGGAVGDDALVGCGRFDLMKGGRVGRDLFAGGGELDLDGDVRRDLKAGGGAMSLAGHVGGDTRVHAERIRLLDGAQLDGDLVYTSDRTVARGPGAVVLGRVEQRMPSGRKPNVFTSTMRFLYGWERSLVGLLALGLILVLPFPAFSRRVFDALGGSPGASLAVGVALLIAVPFVAITVGVIGILLGGWWLGMGTLVIFALALALGITVCGAFLGQRILRRPGREARLLWSLVAGVAILTLAAHLPFVGWFVAALAAVFGLGALAIAARRSGSATVAG